MAPLASSLMSWRSARLRSPSLSQFQARRHEPLHLARHHHLLRRLESPNLHKPGLRIASMRRSSLPFRHLLRGTIGQHHPLRYLRRHNSLLRRNNLNRPPLSPLCRHGQKPRPHHHQPPPHYHHQPLPRHPQSCPRLRHHRTVHLLQPLSLQPRAPPASPLQHRRVRQSWPRSISLIALNMCSRRRSRHSTYQWTPIATRRCVICQQMGGRRPSLLSFALASCLRRHHPPLLSRLCHHRRLLQRFRPSAASGMPSPSLLHQYDRRTQMAI